MHLLLASKSPRRRELLAAMGVPFSVVDINVDEHLVWPVPASQVAQVLATKKADGYKESIGEDEVLVTADTVVVCNGLVQGKPSGRDEAVAMLTSLSGHAHQVYTGVCLRTHKKRTSFSECTEVYFRQLSGGEIDYYVDRFRPYDKAGSYGIQEWVGMVGIERIEGCYYNVMGLPVARLYVELQRLVDADNPFVN